MWIVKDVQWYKIFETDESNLGSTVLRLKLNLLYLEINFVPRSKH